MRAWELLAGSVTAFIVHKKGILKNDYFAFIGLFLIVISIFIYDESTPFPSLYTLVPVIGAMLIVFCADKGTIAARLLSTKVLVSIGLISYSAYLWHQPLFVFAKLFFKDFSLSVFILTIILTFLFAYLSWRYIESPFRKKERISRLNIFIFSIVCSSVFVIFGLLGHLNNGFQSRIKLDESNNIINVVAEEWEFSDYPQHKLIRQAENDYKSIGTTDLKNSSIFLIGDSHAYQYWNSIADYKMNNPEKLLTTNIFLALHSLESLSINSFDFPDKTDKVILSYFWSLHLNNPNVNTFIRCCGNGPGGAVGREYKKISDDELEKKYSNLENFIQNLKSKNIEVILVLDNPFGEELDARSLLNVERGWNIKLFLNKTALNELTTKTALARREPTNSRLLHLAKDYDLEVIDPYNYLCDSLLCSKFDKDTGHFNYKDYDHLSYNTIIKNTQYITDIFKNL